MKLFFYLLTLWPCTLLAQFNESFSDGEILNNPTWFGHVDSFNVNADLQLQLNANAAGSSFIYTPSQVIENASWQFSVAYQFSPSTSNYARIYLAMDNSNPELAQDAIYCDVGRNNDCLELGASINGEEVMLIRGEEGLLSASSNELSILITRSKTTWEMQYNTGQGWQLAGESALEVNFLSATFGIFCEYTKTRIDKFFFDDIHVEGDPFQDHYPPELIDFDLINGECLQLTFNELLDESSLGLSNFYLVKQDQYPNEIQYDSAQRQLRLYYNPALNDVKDEILRISKIMDLSGNELELFEQAFDYKRVEIVNAGFETINQLSIESDRPIPADSWLSAMILMDGIPVVPNSIRSSSDLLEHYLFFDSPFKKEHRYQLQLSQIKDDRGDTIRTFRKEIWYYEVKRFDAVFNELMVDPAPEVGLPESEFIELYNRSPFDLSLQGWTIEVNGKKAELPDCKIRPNDLIILIPSSQKELWSDEAIPVERWPGLNNGGFSLVLRDNRDNVIDAYCYDPDRIAGDGFKIEGGWSVERVDIENMSGSPDNWQWSNNLNGGTPGENNSVENSYIDDVPPVLVYLEMPEDTVVRVIFNEVIDFLNNDWSIELSPSPDYFSVDVESVFLMSLSLHLNTAPTAHSSYLIRFNLLSDWSGNEFIPDYPVQFASCDSLEVGDLIINEVLFNPRPGGVDFVELYNRSDKVIGWDDLYLAKWDDDKVITQLIPFTDKRRLLFPNEYLVVSEDSLIIQEQYQCSDTHNFLNVRNMPSMPDDKGSVVLANRVGQVIDYLEYDEKMHFDLIRDREGVALERLSANQSAQDKQNWHSATSSVGYATPGYKNSQTIQVKESNKSVELDKDVFTPNGDGMDDQVIIRYKNDEVDGTINIRIFDSSGREVRYLANNQIMAADGYYLWDGLDEYGQRLAPGIYVVWIQRFYPSGKVEKDKLVSVLGITD